VSFRRREIECFAMEELIGLMQSARMDPNTLLQE
jgi:hypothetical protein